MIKQEDVQPGDKVCYHPDYFDDDEYQNGIVKEIPPFTPDYVRVVFHCDNQWDRYMEFTAALTHINSLFLGWRNKP